MGDTFHETLLDARTDTESALSAKVTRLGEGMPIIMSHGLDDGSIQSIRLHPGDQIDMAHVGIANTDSLEWRGFLDQDNEEAFRENLKASLRSIDTATPT